MIVNFEISDNYALNYEGRHIDLHNNFEFVGFDYNVPDRKIGLSWKKAIGSWVDQNELLTVSLIHTGVTYLKVVEQDENSIYEDDCCMENITFMPSTFREENDSIIPQPTPNDGDDIMFIFENGQRIRIHCNRIECIMSQSG